MTTSISTTESPTQPDETRRGRHPRWRTAIAAGAFVVGGALSVPAIGWATDIGTANQTTISTGAPANFVPIQAFRAYDSRNDTVNGKIDGDQAGDVGRNQRPIWALGINETGEQLIPSNASAVTYAVSVVQTEAAGFIEIDGFFYADGKQATIVWNGPGARLSNSGVALLSSAFDELGFLGAYVEGAPGAKTHVIIDITGYYVPLP